MLTTLVIGTTAYSSSGLAYSGFSGAGGVVAWGDARIMGLKYSGDDEGYSSAEFTAIGCGPNAPFVPGVQVQMVVSNDDGSSPVVEFAGDLQKPTVRQAEQGWAFGYTCTDLKRRGDYVTISAGDGSGLAQYNLQPDDPLYLYSLAAQTVGQVVAKILVAAPNASALSGLGVGNYGLSGGVYSLPSQTATDLAALSIVPPTPVRLQGESIFHALESLIQDYHPQYTLFVQPDGTIRVISIFGRPVHDFTVPGPTGDSDPVEWPSYTGPDCEGCFTAVQILGLDVETTVLSAKDGTLYPAWTQAQQNAWTIADFTSPKGSTDDGSCTVTSNSATVHSAHPSAFWALNYWDGGQITLYNLATSGVQITSTRQVTSCTALSPGGSATITWDASQPIDSTGYTTYRLINTNTPLAEVSRLFSVCEPNNGPAPGALGAATYVGSHLFPRNPKGFQWANNSQTTLVYYPAAKVLWSSTGAWPYFEVPVICQVNPATGQINLSRPAVQLSAQLAGNEAGLIGGYPATYYQGNFYDVQVAVPFNKGGLAARSPDGGFSGTAFTRYGIQRVKTIHLDSFTWAGDQPALTLLAAEYLKVLQDAVIEGSIVLHFDSWTPTFDVFRVGYAIRLALPGGGSVLDGQVLPVRSVEVEWPDNGPDIHRVTFHFSNKKRPFEGDDLYIHPQFSPQGWGMQGGSLFIGGSVGGMSGVVDMGDFNASLMAAPEPDSGSGGEGDVGGDQQDGGGEIGDAGVPRRPKGPVTPKDMASPTVRNRARKQKEAQRAKQAKADRETFVPKDPMNELMKRAAAGAGPEPKASTEDAGGWDQASTPQGSFGGDTGGVPSDPTIKPTGSSSTFDDLKPKDRPGMRPGLADRRRDPNDDEMGGI